MAGKPFFYLFMPHGQAHQFRKIKDGDPTSPVLGRKTCLPCIQIGVTHGAARNDAVSTRFQGHREDSLT